MSNKFAIERALKTSLTACFYSLNQIDGQVDIRPRVVDQVIRRGVRAVDRNSQAFDLGPIVFRLKERPGARRSDMYVVVSGFLYLQEAHREPFKTLQFGTKVGYFRQKDDEFTHVLGLHYDFDGVTINHPVYHAQLGSQYDMFDAIVEHHRLSEVRARDAMSEVFRGARIPIAQLDFFSVLSQICADHLLEKEPSEAILDAFRRLRGSCGVIGGSAVDHPRLNRPDAGECYRGDHWYA